MGKQNIVTNHYIARNDISSELVNYYIFSGEKIVCPGDIQEADTMESLILSDSGEKEVLLEKYRDILKSCVLKLTEQAAFLLIGIENQTTMHYAMPVRNMLYDAISYSKQIENMARNHKKKKDKMTKEEFLSGITAEDKLLPVITIVVYFGEKKWSAASSLHEMFPKLSPRILEYVEDYHIHLIDPHQMTEEDFRRAGDNLQYVLRFIAASGNMKGMEEDAIAKITDSNVDYIRLTINRNKDA